jgi:predicted nucleic acid-binding protein
MPAKVIDASALAALIFGEPDAEIVAARLEDATLMVPPIFRTELANICWKKFRRHPERREVLLSAHALVDQMEIHELTVPAHQVLLLAVRENLTAYDASYLWLAQELGVELVTLDSDLNDAAQRLENGGGSEA